MTERSRRMAKTLTYIAVVVLAVIAVILGYKIYQQTTGLKTQDRSIQQQNTSVPQDVRNQSSPGAAQNIDVEALMKQFPTSNSSEEERRKFNDYLLSLGQEVDTITISSNATSNCNPTPQVLRIIKGAEIKIVNQDTVDHKLSMFQKDILAKAGQTTTVKTDWGTGAFGYVCDGTGPRVGILLIIDTE